MTCLGPGILGVGYELGEGLPLSETYANFPVALVKAGAIKSPAFSLWMDKHDTGKNGKLLFGGVDTSKYTGELQTLPIASVHDQYPSLSLVLTNVSSQKGGSSPSQVTHGEPSGYPLFVTLDTGLEIAYLPAHIAESIYTEVGVTLNASESAGYESLPTLPCDINTEDLNVTFSFSSVDINVPISQFLLSPVEKNVCPFGVFIAPSNVSVLGDPFFRSAYVVFDLENNEISLAQSNWNPSDEEHIVEIGTGSDSVPGATKVASVVTTAVNQLTGLPSVTSTGPPATATALSSGSGAGSQSPSSSSSSGFAALPTANVKHIAASLVGAGLLFAL